MALLMIPRTNYGKHYTHQMGQALPAGRYRPGGSPLSSAGCRSCRCMERFLIRGWDHIVLGWHWLISRSQAYQRSASGVGISTPCGAVPTRGITVFVPGLSELQMYRVIYDPGMGYYRPLVALIFFRDLQRVNDWPVGLRFPHRARLLRPVGSAFSSPGC